MKRTNYAGETSEQQIGQEVVVKGWVAKRRNLGGLIFIDLWDRSGIVQLVFDEKIDPAAFESPTRCGTNTSLKRMVWCGLVRKSTLT
jgi:aspartyl-tRNA synthetase